MEKEFIPYEQALALKQLGFDEPCFATYDEDEDFELQDFFQTYNTFPDHIVAASTFSQAFRWFREKYNLDCSIELDVVNYGSKNSVYFEKRSYKYCITKSFKSPFYIESKSFKSYEEAELECLKKLIEIVKNGK